MKTRMIPLLFALFTAVAASAEIATVQNLNDSGPDSLRAAIDGTADMIVFSLETIGTIGLTSELIITNNLTIIGPSALTITVSGSNTTRVFNVLGGNVNISGLTIANGNATQGGGIYHTNGTLRIEGCAFTNNVASEGGAFFNANGYVTVRNSTFSGNAAYGLGGGGIWTTNITGSMLQILHVDTCTFSGNVASNNSFSASGGAIMSCGRSGPGSNTVRVLNTTISSNYADFGGGIYHQGTGYDALIMANTIVAGNNAFSVPDVYGSITSLGYNLIGKTDGSSGWVGSDQTGTIAFPLDPFLDPLGYYGGPTKTMALRLFSTAIDAGLVSGTDQRGIIRPQDDAGIVNGTGNGSDIGAYEAETNVYNLAAWRGVCSFALWHCPQNWYNNVLPTNSMFSALVNYRLPTGTNFFNAFVDITTASSYTNTMTMSNLLVGAGCSVIVSNIADAGHFTPFRVTGDLSIQDAASVVVFNSSLPFYSNSLQVDGTTRVGSSGAASLTLLSGFTQLNNLEVAGDFAEGTVNMNGGTVTIQGALTVGAGSNSVGFFILNGGYVTQTNGTFGVGNSGNLTNGTGVGFVIVSNATLDTASIILGSTVGGEGEFTMETNSTVIIRGGLMRNKLVTRGGLLQVFAGAPSFEDPILHNRIVGGYQHDSAMDIIGGTINAIEMVSGLSNGTDVITMTGGQVNLSSNFLIGVHSSATGMVNILGGTVVVTNGTIGIGNRGALNDGAGVGQMIISNATVIAKDVKLGSSLGGAGKMIIKGGGLLQFPPGIGSGCATCGFSQNELILDGGTVEGSNTSMYAGQAHPGEAVIMSGSAVISNIFIGYDNLGTFTQSGGSVQALGRLGVGFLSGSTGFVWISGGTLIATNTALTGITFVGAFGRGQAVVSNGTVLANEEDVGFAAGSSGTLTLAGGTNLLTGALTIGRSANATGALWLTSGQLVVTNPNTYVADSGVGQMTISNGTAQGATVWVGASSGSRGTLTMAGGTYTMSSFLVVAGSANATGTVWMTGGQMNLNNSAALTVARPGVGRMTVSNGVIVARLVQVANPLANALGTLTFAGGTNHMYSSMVLGLPGCTSTGIVIVTGGNVYVTNGTQTATIDVESGTLTISGGFVQVDELVVTNACARFLKTGGTLLIGTTNIAANLDADGDGLPNSWETSYGFSPFNDTGSDGPNGDPDGDGFSNLQEFLAGTDPTSSASALRITAIARVANTNILVTWIMGSGKTNALQRTAGTANGSYSTNNFADIYTVANTVGPTTNYLDIGAATNFPAQYYRIRLVP